MKICIYSLLVLVMASCSQQQTQSIEPEPELATSLAGTYKASGVSIAGGPEINTNPPNDSLTIEAISSTVAKVSFRVKSCVLDSREKEYVTITREGKDYYSFNRAEGYSLMVYQYDHIKLVLADTYYTLYFIKVKN